MRRKPYLSLLLALAILAGMFALFPELWMLLVIALLALVTLQVILVRRNLYRLPPGYSQVAYPPNLDMPSRAAAAGALPATSDAAPATAADGPAATLAPTTDADGPAAPAPAAPPAPSAVPTAAAPARDPDPSAGTSSAPRPNIDTALFSRFRRHLEQVETGAAGAQGGSAPASATEVEDRVELSGAARRPAGKRTAARPAPRATPPVAPAAEEPAEEPESGDLFADLRPGPVPAVAPPPAGTPLPATQAPPRRPPEVPARAATAQPAAEPPAEVPALPGARRARTRAPATPAGDEVSAALAVGSDGPALADEAGALLHLAEDAAQRENWDGLRARLDNYLAHLADAPQLIDQRARRLQVRLAVRDGDVNRALQGFEELLATGHRPPADEVPALLDELLGPAQPAVAASLRVSMLVRILAVFRQARDQRAMDRCYGWIEEAQEQVGDERRLLQYLKNHLEIRKALGDVPGQLELIDQLGNRCYRLGLTEDAKLYYEMGLRLRAEADPGAETPLPPGSAAEG